MGGLQREYGEAHRHCAGRGDYKGKMKAPINVWISAVARATEHCLAVNIKNGDQLEVEGALASTRDELCRGCQRMINYSRDLR